MKHIPTFKEFLNEERIEEGIKTEGYLEPEEVTKFLVKLYHILTNNRRDYASIHEVDKLTAFLKKHYVD